MSKGPGSVWISIQMSPAEKERLDAAVAQAKKAEPLTNRNRFIRAWIASLSAS